MDGFLHVRGPSHDIGTLFAEDFDAPPAAAREAGVLEPSFSADDLAVAREAGRREGHAAGLEEAATAETAATRQALEQIASQLVAECELAAMRAEESAEAIARVLLDSLAAALPALCARHGDAEAAAVVRAVLPALAQEPAITIRAHPSTATAITQEISRLDTDLTARVQTVACDSMQPGNVRIAWRNGAAVRDAGALCQQVAAVLLPGGLLSADVAKETFDGR